MAGSTVRRGNLLRWLHAAEDALLAVALTALVGIAALQIGARLLLDLGWNWVEESSRLLVLWIALLGALAATRERRHIAIDLLPRLLPPLGRRIAWILAQLFAAAVSALMAWGSVDFVLLERDGGATAFGSLPVWVSLLILPAGFALIAVRMLVAACLPPPVDDRVD